MFQYEELGEEVRNALEEILRARREVEEQTSRILDAEGLEEAKQHFLIHQVSFFLSFFFFILKCTVISFNIPTKNSSYTQKSKLKNKKQKDHEIVSHQHTS